MWHKQWAWVTCGLNPYVSVCICCHFWPLTLLYQGHIAPWNFTLTRPLLWPMWKRLMNKEECLLEGVVQLQAFRYTGLCIPSRAVHTIKYCFNSSSKIYIFPTTVSVTPTVWGSLVQLHNRQPRLYMVFCWNLNFIRVLNVIIVWKINKTCLKFHFLKKLQ